jgi:nucleoside-diphosphate-sugar epimerase
MMRDFTYIDDVIEGVFRVMVKPPQSSSLSANNSPQENKAPYDSITAIVSIRMTFMHRASYNSIQNFYMQLVIVLQQI